MHETLTKCTSNMGFSGNSSILPRINFGVIGQDSSPQSHTAATLDRWACIPHIRKTNYFLLLTTKTG